jgi:hypothetical protein
MDTRSVRQGTIQYAAELQISGQDDTPLEKGLIPFATP